MTEIFVDQLVFGGRTVRYEIGRNIEAAIHHLKCVEDRLVDSQGWDATYDGEYNHRIVEVLTILAPVHAMLEHLRLSLYVYKAKRAVVNVSDSTVQRVLENERRICLNRVGLGDSRLDCGKPGSGGRYPITVGSHSGIENPDTRRDS